MVNLDEKNIDVEKLARKALNNPDLFQELKAGSGLRTTPHVKTVSKPCNL
jgi:hypothetical protein